jgi:hypothetical protein
VGNLPSHGRPCRVCRHPRRAEIDQALISHDMPRLSLAAKFDISKQSLDRHLKNHLSGAAMAAGAAAVIADAAAHGETLAETAHALLGKARDLLAKAERDGDYKVALMGVREASRCCDLIGRLQGDLSSSVTLNITAAPVVIQLQTVVLTALADFPDARAAVAHALSNTAGSPLLIEHAPAD